MFFAVSADDFHRTLYAWEVTQGNLVPSDLWPPLQFWVEALVLQVYPRLLSVPYLVNLAASTGALTGLILLGRTWGLNQFGALIVITLVATLPWFVWLSLSGLAEPLFFLGITAGYLGVARWRVRQHDGWLWIAAFSLLAAGMLRFDAWGHSVVFTLAVAWCWWRAPRPRPWSWLAAAALPWAFPLIWLTLQYMRFDNPFYFSSVTRDYWLLVHGPLPLAERLVWQPRDLWRIAGIFLPISLIGLWLWRKRPGIVILSLMWLGSFALLMQSTLSHTITQNNPARLVVIHVLLLSPGAAFALQQFSRRSWLTTALSIALVIGSVAPRFGELPRYPNGLAADVEQVGWHIGGLRTLGALQPGDRLMIEVIFWDYIPLHVITNDPGAVIYDRPPTLVIAEGGQHTLDDASNPSLLALPAAQLRSALREQHVRLVVTHSQRAADNLRPIADESLAIGRFRVFLLPRQ